MVLRLVTRSPGNGDRVLLDFAHLNAELNRPGVTLALLWGKHAVANAGQLTHLRAGIVQCIAMRYTAS